MSSRSLPELPAPAALAIHLDAVGGIAGDMFVAAMVDALPALAAPVLEALAAVKPPGRALPELVAATSGGIAARRFGAASASAYAHVGRPVAAFDDIDWSTPDVLAQTRAALARDGARWAELEVLWDVDTAADLERWHAPPPATA